MFNPRQNTEAEIEAFDQVCRRLGGFEPGLDPEWIDGYLTALAAGPRVVPIEEWLPRLCGDAFERAFADPQDVAQAMAALSARTRVLADELDPEWLLDEPGYLRLQPLMSQWDDEARRELVETGELTAEQAAELLTGAAWADGFRQAMEDFEADWRDPPDTLAAGRKHMMLAQVSALLLPEGEELRKHLALWHRGEARTRDELVDDACFAIQDLRVWWLDHAPKPPTRRVAALPGRNEPCHCGSGRKFKKCHGA